MNLFATAARCITQRQESPMVIVKLWDGDHVRAGNRIDLAIDDP